MEPSALRATVEGNALRLGLAVAGGLGKVGGVIISAQLPPTAKGTTFLALEGEGGLINVVLKQKVYEVSQKALKSPFVVVEGKLQRRGQAISVLAREVITLEASP